MTQEQAINKVKEYIKKTWGDWEPDWKERQEKYYIFFSKNGVLQFEYWHSSSKQYSPIGYLKSEEQIDELRTKFPQELELIYS